MTLSDSPSAESYSAALLCHPATPCAAVHRIDVQVVWSAGASLELRYTAAGDIDRLLVPAQTEARRADKLWQHTCFETFVAGSNAWTAASPAQATASGQRTLAGDAATDGTPAGQGEYYELNFSPSTQWAIYRFSAYREGMTAVQPARPPRITSHCDADGLTLEAHIELESLSGLRDAAGLRLALSAVIEDKEHRLSYWALAHPQGKPDFHHAHGFALRIPNRRSGCG